MKFNKWTLGLAAVGAVSLASAARADETKMSQLNTALSDTTISGYVDTAATWRPGTDSGPASGNIFGANIPAYAFAKNDGFSLNAVDIAIDRPMDESPWAAGYHVEMMFGPDSVPLGNASVAGVSAGGIIGGLGVNSLRQAYLSLRTPIGNSGIDWKVGVFDTIIGYESSSDPLDPNYTRSYGYSIEPTTHTGILGTYKVNDMLSFSAGVANTWNSDTLAIVSALKSGLNNTATYESQKTYMGAIALTAPDSAGWLKGATLNAGVVNGVDSSANGLGSTTSWYVGATIPTPNNNLKAGASFDYLDLHNGGGEAWVAALYASYQINDKASFNLRGEYLQDDVGLYGANVVAGRDAAEELTATLQYNLWANVISRLEFRWDHVEHGTPFGVSSATGDAFRANDFMLALNLIYQF
jgi:hypothetical protein